jgi:hypothetical protein
MTLVGSFLSLLMICDPHLEEAFQTGTTTAASVRTEARFGRHRRRPPRRSIPTPPRKTDFVLLLF